MSIANTIYLIGPVNEPADLLCFMRMQGLKEGQVACMMTTGSLNYVVIPATLMALPLTEGVRNTAYRAGG